MHARAATTLHVRLRTRLGVVAMPAGTQNNAAFAAAQWLDAPELALPHALVQESSWS